jgi:hypothetical protein
MSNEDQDRLRRFDEEITKNFIHNMQGNAAASDELMALAPTATNARAAGAEFDRENELLERALQELVTAYPRNTTPHHVFLKATALNTMYSTFMPLYHPTRTDMYDVADHICRYGDDIDQALADGVAEVVDLISTPVIEGKQLYRPFSFATKYASWHKPESYPIWDAHVRAYLIWLQREWGFTRDFKVDGSWKYAAFREAITRLRDQYSLGEFSFKELDKFLYRAGGVLVAKGIVK